MIYVFFLFCDVFGVIFFCNLKTVIWKHAVSLYHISSLLCSSDGDFFYIELYAKILPSEPQSGKWQASMNVSL